MSAGWSGAFLRFAAMLCLLLWAAACGRLGYGLRDPDADARADADGGARSARQLSLNELAGIPIVDSTRRDAGLVQEPTVQPPTAAGAPQRIDAGIPDPSAPPLANGQACDGDRACASGACVSGACCETQCSEPGPCQSAQGVSCAAGSCVYATLEDGASCDDDNACTTGDRCYRGLCFGSPRDCDDGEDCTSDFCTAGSCTHASSCDPDADACSYGTRDDHGYWMCPSELSFDDAQAQCSRIGSHLVTINDAGEQSYLWRRGMRDTWIGYRAHSGARFKWLSGDSQYDDWVSGEPDAGMDRCAYLSAAHGGAWDSHGCEDDSSGFACEIDQYAPPDAGCKYLRGLGEGYFICRGPRLWADAQRACKNIGAELAEISGALEQGFLAFSLESGTRYAIGLHDRAQAGQFAWDSGEPLRYTAWDDMQPAPVSRGASYVVMDGYSGAWSTASGMDAVGYVCEQQH